MRDINYKLEQTENSAANQNSAKSMQCDSGTTFFAATKICKVGFQLQLGNVPHKKCYEIHLKLKSKSRGEKGTKDTKVWFSLRGWRPKLSVDELRHGRGHMWQQMRYPYIVKPVNLSGLEAAFYPF